jgi:hypothetical protein
VEEWMEKHEYHEAAIDDATEQWMFQYRYDVTGESNKRRDLAPQLEHGVLLERYVGKMHTQMEDFTRGSE